MFIEKIKEKNLLFLSPHYDDIAISCGGLLHKISSECNFKILNVFTISNYAPYIPNNKNIEEISEIRKDEDLRFCKSLDIEHIDLKFNEAPLRGFSSLNEVFKGYLSRPEETLLSEIKNIFKNYLSFDFIFAPIGFCSHVDHELVKMAASVFNKTKIIYYEEQSYLGELDIRSYLKEIYRMRFYSPIIIEISSIIEKKICYAQIYKSQISKKEIDNIITGASRCSAGTPFKYSERYWMNS